VDTGRLQRLIGPYAVLRGNASLDLLLAAQALSALIEWLYVVALFALAYGMTHSATTVALLTFTRLLPYAALVPVSGAIADRFDRKGLAISANVGRALCLCGLATIHTRAGVPLAFACVFAATLLASLFRTAVLSAVPAVVGARDLIQANSLMSQIDMVAVGVGPALAAVILRLGQPRLAFLLAGGGLLLAAAAVACASIRRREAEPAEGHASKLLAHTLSGFGVLLRQHEGALGGIALTLAGFSLENGAFWAITTVLADHAFHLGAGGLGLLMTPYSIGGLLCGIVVGEMAIRRGFAVLFTAAAALSSLALLVFGVSPAGVLPFLCLFVIGVADVSAKVVATTLLQAGTPDALLGRVFGALEAILMGTTAVGALAVGPLIAALGARQADVLVSVTGLLLLLVSVPSLRLLERTVGGRAFLRQVPTLQQVPIPLLDELEARLQPERIAAGATIIREGEVGDRLYIIRRGSVAVSACSADGRRVAVATLGRGAYFGEIALVRDVPRTATVRAREATLLYSLSRADFQELLARSRELHATMIGTSAVRYLDTQARLVPRL
jgi:MFS family permease